MPSTPTTASVSARKATCEYRDCDRPVRRGGLCQAHDARRWRGTDMDAPIRRYNPGRECSDDGCERTSGTRGLCNMHYESRRRRGQFSDIAQQCLAVACDMPAHCRGYCSMHYQRKRNGVPEGGRIKGTPTFVAVHLRVKRLWGLAACYPCIQCDEQAKDWAYDGTDPTQLLGYSSSDKTKGVKQWYSQWPEFYMPMCRRCHARRDSAKAIDELAEYRTWKFVTREALAPCPDSPANPFLAMAPDVVLATLGYRPSLN